MLVNRIQNNNIYNLYLYQKQNTKKSNIINFRGKYQLGENFEFLNEQNLDTVTELFCAYRENAGQTNISTEKTKQYISKNINNPEHNILTIKDDGEYAGFLMFSKTRSTIDLHPFFVIDALFVSPEHRGKKLSSRLVKELQSYAKYNNYKGIHVKTWANNVESNRLYQNTGFNNESLKYSTYFWANSGIFNYSDKYMSDASDKKQ
ncbi:GNAT family N-acetyltransferase [bacterium]|nr:GNAT family N-acetyltransferase [bacterium]